jgi:predicted transcriptional regulator
MYRNWTGEIMATKAVFTMKLEPELHDVFMAEAAAADRPAAQIVRDLMRGYIEQCRRDREYKDYMRRKIEIAQADKRAGRSYSNEEVEAEFSALRMEDEAAA